MAIVKCAWCGKEKEVPNCRLKRQDRFFCNLEHKHLYYRYAKGTREVACEVCGKKVLRTKKELEKAKHYFCSRQCSGEYRKKRVTFSCDWCGKPVEYPESHADRSECHFCDAECDAKWRSTNIRGKNHYAYNQIEVACDQCGKVFTQKISRVKKYKKKFCSRNCYDEYLRTHPISEEKRRMLRRTALKTLSTYPRETSIEKAIRKWLEKEEIYHIPQHVINNKFCVDFYLPEHNVIIEALGDYFHANPKIYGKGLISLNDIQRQNIGRDKSRFAYLKKCGYSLYGFWECDIKADLDGLMATITGLKQSKTKLKTT